MGNDWAAPLLSANLGAVVPEWNDEHACSGGIRDTATLPVDTVPVPTPLQQATHLRAAGGDILLSRWLGVLSEQPSVGYVRESPPLLPRIVCLHSDPVLTTIPLAAHRAHAA